MNTKLISITIAVLLGAMIASSRSLASPIIDVTYAGSADFGTGPVGYFTGSVVPNPNSAADLVGVAIGGDSLTSNDHSYDFSASGQFNGWCIDIYHWMAGSSAYYVETGTELANALNVLRPNGAQRVADIGRLANEVYITVDSKTESAAFQLAIWAIAYGITDLSGKYHIDTANAGFRTDDATALSSYGNLANLWLDNLDSAPSTANWTLTYLNDGTLNNTQDLIVFIDPPATVPEPASLALLALGLVGFRVGKRKYRGQSRM